MKLLALLPITKGQWEKTTSQEWEGFYFMETVLDWSILPSPCYGKLYVEMMDDTRGNSEVHEIGIRLAYQQEPAKFIPVEGSEIFHKGSKRWQLLASDYFLLPIAEKGVSCLWIQGKTSKGGVCAVALVTLAIFEVEE